jgi:hypothetical protein
MSEQTEALSDDDGALQTPAGYVHLMLMAAYAKRGLQYQMKPGKRLKLLELLNSLTDNYFTPDMLATIEPMSDTEMAMVSEARSLDREDDRLGNASFDVLTSPKVFGHFLKLNPSFVAAIKLRQQMTATGAVPAQTFGSR